MVRHPKRITVKDALEELVSETGKRKYTKLFTSAHIGSWEEIKLTELHETFIILKEFPYHETFFYQTYKDPEPGGETTKLTIGNTTVDAKSHRGIPLADNADIIWLGYRETIGSGHRVRTAMEAATRIEYLLEQVIGINKQIAKEIVYWYKPYIEIRKYPGYKETSGFELG